MAAHDFHDKYRSPSFSSSKSDWTTQGTHPWEQELLHTKIPLPGVCSRWNHGAGSLCRSSPALPCPYIPGVPGVGGISAAGARRTERGSHTPTVLQGEERQGQQGARWGISLSAQHGADLPHTTSCGCRKALTCTRTATLDSSVNTPRAFPRAASRVRAF